MSAAWAGLSWGTQKVRELIELDHYFLNAPGNFLQSPPRAGLRRDAIDHARSRAASRSRGNLVKNKNGGAVFSYGEARRYLELLPNRKA
jgi:hypothetical protein